MQHLTRDQLMSLEQYAERRADFRQQVIDHKKHRRVGIGPHLNLYFEDRLTVQYQVQEMLRIERIFEPEAIEEELAAYNPLIPDGGNLKCTAMLEYQDVEQRKAQLAQLKGIENQVWLRVEGFDPVYAIANEDLERSNEEKTSAVHFMRFELEPEMIDALHSGAELRLGVEHDLYRHQTTVTGDTRTALLADLATG
ncbi:MAG TPA: DUF3501 family protein [Xanthomonadales bacterium]|nr:DUF3501 family protein [Xanthomonadales bacterium]